MINICIVVPVIYSGRVPKKAVAKKLKGKLLPFESILPKTKKSASKRIDDGFS